MRTRSTLPGAFRRGALALLVLAIAGAIGLLLVAFRGHSAVPPLGGAAPTATLNKVQLGNAMLATQQALAQQDGPHKTVIPTTPAPTPASCPFGMGQSDINRGDGKYPPGIVGTNVATIPASPSNPLEYVISAGASMVNPQQGLLVVFSQPGDPCAHPEPTNQIIYDTPYQRGALTLTAIRGDSVSFSLADGGTGQFNYITNTYS